MYKVIQSSIVVVSSQNNPSLMTPQFLREYEIIPPDWKAVLKIESPVFSQAAWENGLSIKSEAGRVIFQYDASEGQPQPYEKECLLGDITEKFISQLSKVKYTAVGINFSSICDEIENVQEEFSKLFLSSDLNQISNISQESIKISRKLDDLKTQNLTIEFGKFIGPGKYSDVNNNPMCLTLKGNLNCDITKATIHDSWQEAMNIIKSWEKFYVHFSSFVNEIENLWKVKK
jgi:hypothetical protein